MPIYAISIVLLIVLSAYLIYKLEKAKKEKIILLIRSRFSDSPIDNTWEVFDSMIEAKASMKCHRVANKNSKDLFIYQLIKTTKYIN